MNEEKYFEQIESSIKSLEVKKRIRSYKDNSDTLLTYFTIGKLLIEAQGGESRAKYGNKLIKEWSFVFTEKYGKGYNISNLKRFRQFYIIFQKGAPLGHQLAWTHIKYILPLKDENERNYYVNLVIKNNLSKNELISEIKSDSYGRLLNKPDHIEIINNDKLNPLDKLKNPIIINLKKDEKINNEHDLEVTILSELSFFLN